MTALPPGPHADSRVRDVEASDDLGTVYVTGGVAGEDDAIRAVTVALSASTGRVLWTAIETTPGEMWSTGIYAKAFPGNQTVVIAGFRALPANPDPGEAILIGYDAFTGERRWERALTHPGSEGPADTVADRGRGTFYAAIGSPWTLSAPYRILALDAGTGELAWEHSPPDQHGGWPEAIGLATQSDRLFFNTYVDRWDGDGKEVLVSVNASTGAVQWTRERASDVVGAHLVAEPDGKQIYVAGSVWPSWDQRDVGIQAYDGESGHPLWDAVFSGPIGAELTGAGRDAVVDLGLLTDPSRVVVVAHSDTYSLFATSRDSVLLAYDGTTGELIWNARYDGGADDDPAAADSLAVSTSVANRVYMLSTSETVQGPALNLGAYDIPEEGPTLDPQLSQPLE